MAAATLQGSDPGGARPAMDLAANRARLLDALHDYAVAGDFPRNTDTPSGRTLYFLDPDGRACAVAHLMIQSGRMSDVRAIAATQNAVKVTPHTGGAIADWIRTSGFTVADVMAIQEPDGYGYSGPDVDAPAIVNADRARIQKRLLAVERRLRAASVRTTPVLTRG